MNSNSSTDCPFCTVATVSFVLDGETFHRCPDCGLIVKDRAGHLSVAAELARYDHHSMVADTGYRTMMTTFLRDFALPFATIKTAIDFGCGRIRLISDLLAAEGFLTACYDPFYEADEVSLSRRYGLITATEVVEHFRDPGKSWAILAGLPASAGIIAIMTRFIPADFSSWWYRRDPTHVCFYTRTTMNAIARKYGLRILCGDERGNVTFKKD